MSTSLCHSLCRAMAQKFGYDNVEDFKEHSQKTFSLAETGILEQDSSRLLLVNVSQYLLRCNFLPFSFIVYQLSTR